MSNITLKEIYQGLNLHSISDNQLAESIKQDIAYIGRQCYKQKGVYTVLVTLLYYKILHPEQDVRIHQTQLPNGFSGRSFDTQNVTPILKELGLPSMAESGWLTRSLEQPYPYTMEYNGKISSGCKGPFLRTLDYIQKNPNSAKPAIEFLLSVVKEQVNKNKLSITPLTNKENLTIDKIIKALDIHFNKHYGTHNGAKLPVLAFYAIYTCIIKEMTRYNECKLAPLSSLTACDNTSKASGDIEIFKNDQNFESIEIKLDKKIDKQIVMVVRDKIYKFNPIRYYILSYNGIKEEDKTEIQNIINDVRATHGCQIIINGLLPTIKYYLRLISNLSDFMDIYSRTVESDQELQFVHKTAWNLIMRNLNNNTL